MTSVVGNIQHAELDEHEIRDVIELIKGIKRPGRRPTPFASSEIPTHKRVGFYARYSSPMQAESYSLQAQHNSIDYDAEQRARETERRAYESDIANQHSAYEQNAEQRSAHDDLPWEVVYYDEPETSAFVEDLRKRPMFLRMMWDAVNGKLDLVVVHKVDRFARRMQVTSDCLKLLKDLGVGFLSLSEPWLDVTCAAGWVQAQLIFMLAEYYSRNLSEEVKKGKLVRASDRKEGGLHAGSVAFGYRRTGRKSAAVPDTFDGRVDEQGRKLGGWEGLQTLFQLALAGLSDEEIANKLNADGRWYLSSPTRQKLPNGKLDRARPFTRNSVSEIRRNPYYCPFEPDDPNGTIVMRNRKTGETRRFRGRHQAACSWEDWHAMQEIARNRRKGWLGHEKSRLPIPDTAEFRQLAVCASCGWPLLVHRTANPKGTKADPSKVYVYEKYTCKAEKMRSICPSTGYYAFVEDVRDAWIAYIEKHLRLPDDWEQRIQAYIAGMIAHGSHESSGTPIESTQRLRQKIQHWKEMERRWDVMYEHGRLTDAEYRQRLTQADAEIRILENRTQMPQQRIARLHNTAQFTQQLAELWPDMTKDQRINMASRLIEPRGLVVRLLGHGTALKRTRWEAAAGIPRKPTCELVEVRLRPAFRELLQATTDSNQ